MTILVTGGAGFIGSNLVHYLIKETEHSVIVLDNLSTGRIENLPCKPNGNGNSRLELWDKADVKYVDTFTRNFYNRHQNEVAIDAIVHLAAPTSVQESKDNPEKYRAEIVDGTKSVLEIACEKKIPRVVLASTAAVYGDPARLPVNEDSRSDPLVPYAWEKFTAECITRAACENGITTAVLRFFNVYGPRQHPNSSYSGVISKFMRRIAQNEPPTIFGDGTQTRDFVHVDDVVQAIMAALTNPDLTPGLTVNIGTGTGTTINALAGAVIALGGKDLKPTYEAARLGDIQHSCADIGRARKTLGYAPTVTLKEGLRTAWEWHCSSLTLQASNTPGKA